MDNKDIIELVDKRIDSKQRESLYTTKNPTYHTHNGIDSPILSLISMGGFPGSYRGKSGYTLTVNSGATGLQFTDFTFLNLNDTPNSYTSQGGKSVVVNAAATALVFGSLPSTVLFDHYADVGNVNTSESDLYSDSTAAGQLATNGDKLEAEYGGIFVSSGTATREIKIYFAATQIFDTGALTLSLSSAWTAYVTIIRVSVSTFRYMVSFTTEGAALSAYTAVGEITSINLAAANVIKITGQAAGAGASSDNIVAKMGYVEYKPHA